MLTVFEVSAHPARSVARTQGALAMLDNLIRTLSLTYIDAENPSTTTFAESENPTDPGRRGPAYPLPLYSRARESAYYERSTHPSSRLLHREPHPKPSDSRCICSDLTLGRHWSGAQEHAPLWLSTAAWDPSWTVTEIKREECRRLCWNALSIAAGYSTFRSAHGLDTPDMFVLQPANVSPFAFSPPNFIGLKPNVIIVSIILSWGEFHKFDRRGRLELRFYKSC